MWRTLHRLFAGAGRSCRAFSQFLPLFFRQFLVFTPALVQLVVFIRWKLLHALVALDRLGPLLRRQRNPFLHALLNALLPIRRQARIAGRQPDPVFASFRIELVPLRLEGGQNGFLLWRQFRPGGTRRIRIGGIRERAYADEQEKCQDYCFDCS